MYDTEFSDIYLNAKDHPIIKEWEVGKTYKVMVEMKQLNKNESQKGMSAGMKIMSIKAMDKKPDEMNSKEHKDYIAMEMRKHNG